MTMRVCSISSRIRFSAGHRVMGHASKCSHLHGHNYTIIVTATADLVEDVEKAGVASILMDRIGGWIKEKWDHGFIIHEDDNEAERALGYIKPNGRDQKVHRMPYNPTAENMARYLAEVIFPTVVPEGLECVRVEVWETEGRRGEWARG